MDERIDIPGRSLSAGERRALERRHKAAIHVIRTEPTTEPERVQLLAAVVWPEHDWLQVESIEAELAAV